MQEFYDEQNIQVKKLAKFDIEKEEAYKRMSCYEFIFHVWVLDENNQ